MAPTGSYPKLSSISSKSGSTRWTLTAAAAPQHVESVSFGHYPGLLVLGLTLPGKEQLRLSGPNRKLQYRLEARPKSPIQYCGYATPRRRRHRDTSPIRRRGRALQPGHARDHRSLNAGGLLLFSTLASRAPPLCTHPLGPHAWEAGLFTSTQKAAVHAGEAATATVCFTG